MSGKEISGLSPFPVVLGESFLHVDLHLQAGKTKAEQGSGLLPKLLF